MKQLDLLLINAPSKVGVYGALSEFAAIEPPVWAGLIARYCLNRGFSVEILDAEAEELTTSETATRINDAKPHLAAFCVYGHQPSASTQCLPGAEAVAKLVDGRIPTLCLGTHPSALPERTLKEGPWTYVCQGEGPETILRLLSVLTSPVSDHVPGLWIREEGYTVKPPRNIENLDQDLPSQAWELLDMTKYRPHHWHKWMGDPNGGYATIQTSLGCTFRCQFCCIQAPFGEDNPRMRFWSPANVATQIANLVNQYSITNIKIADEMFCLNKQHVWQICNHLIDMKLGDKLNIWCYGRVDTVKDQQLLNHMRRAGIKDIGIGIESASLRVRNSIEKGKFRDDDILAAVKRVNAAGIHVGANFIFGLPSDTLDSMIETYDLACELNSPYTNMYTCMAYPGSPLHTIAKERGWQLPEDNGGPGWIGYSQHSYETLPLPTETLTAAQVLTFRDEAFMKFHQRPEYLSMLQTTFGDQAVADMKAILAHGKPKRKLLEPSASHN